MAKSKSKAVAKEVDDQAEVQSGEMVSITQALSQCNILADRINRIYNDSELAISDYVVNGKLQNHPGKTKEEFLKEVKSKLQSAQDLVDRLYRIKTRIAHSNATTMLKVAGKEYSPYSLMLLLNNNQFDKPTLLNNLKTRHASVKSRYDKKVEEAEQRALNTVIAGLGAQTSATDLKASIKSGAANKDVLDTYQKFLTNNSPELIQLDNDAAKFLEDNLRQYEDFIMEARAALDIYNVMTKVCID